MVRRLAACALVAAACGTDDTRAGDPFPIHVDRAGGALIAQVGIGDDAPVTAVIDVMSPLTVFDAPLGAAVRRRGVDLALYGHRSATDSTLIARARFAATGLVLHPCETADPCTVGSPSAATPIGAVIGGDTLHGDALRIRAADDVIAVLPDVAGDGTARDALCDAEVLSPFYGGSTLVVGGTELAFGGWRPTLSVCLSPDPTATDPTARGVDAAVVLSTGIGPSILAQSRYAIWRQATGAPTLDELPTADLLLPSGLLTGKLAELDGLAVVGAAAAARDACGEVAAHHLLAERDCTAADGASCPCTGETFCSVPSVVELDRRFQALIVPDDTPLLQALRTELRPAQPEIDGVLGLDALDTTELDVDYPHNRLLLRCAGAGCTARPTLRDRASRPIVAACVAQAVPAVDAGVDAP